MNLKLFKKIIKNLLKFVHIALSLVINALLMGRGQGNQPTNTELDTKKPSKPLFYRNSHHEFIKDVGYIHREE